VLGTVVFVIALKLLGLLLALVGFVIGLIKLAVIFGLFVLAGWLVYKFISPRQRTEHV
jgi:hypothetical protein